MTATPTVSVVTATYNRGPRIGKTLDSVFAETRPADEVVVVDDASPDGTGAWVRDHYPAVRVITRDRNGGTSAARNHGAREARGDILVFLDHDDELLPHAIETLLGQLRQFPEARAAFANHGSVDTVNDTHCADHHAEKRQFARLRSVRATRETPEGRLYADRAMYYALLYGNLLQQPWAVYRDTFLALGGFGPEVRYCEDWDLYLRVAYAAPLVLSDRVISRHSIHGENLGLAEGQEEMHRVVLYRQLAARRWWEVRARGILYRRLGMWYKTRGDQLSGRDLREAWRTYVRSFRAWPFDYVVAARTLLWPLRLAFAPRGNDSATTAGPPAR